LVRQRLDNFWIDKLYATFANESRISDREVTTRMQKLGEEMSRDDYPATRTVNKYRDLFNHLPENVKAGHKDFCWPESMEAGLLPWEAGAAALELLGIQRGQDLLLSPRGLGLAIGRPSVRLARWFWRVTQAAPDLPAFLQEFEERPGRYYVAMALAVRESVGDMSQGVLDGVEAYLAYAPWRSRGNAGQYGRAIDAGQIPDLSVRNLFPRPTNPYPAIRELIGREFAEYWEKVLHNPTPQQQSDEMQEDTNGEAQG
jgi:hypothetical protein